MKIHGDVFWPERLFPFNRAELKTTEPEIYTLMEDIWGPIQTGVSS